MSDIADEDEDCPVCTYPLGEAIRRRPPLSLAGLLVRYREALVIVAGLKLWSPRALSALNCPSSTHPHTRRTGRPQLQAMSMVSL